MGAVSSAQIKQTLTTYASGLSQDINNALAEFFAPTVVVGVSSGQYKQYNGKNAFQTVDSSRATGGSAKRIEFSADDANFNCKPQALEIAIDDSEREAAGDAQDALEQSKTSTLVSTSVTSHEAKVLSTIAANVSSVAGAGVWSDVDVDPIKEIDDQIEAITVATGMMPNRLGIGLSAWKILRNHPKVIARQPGAQIIGLSTTQLAAMLINPAVEIRVGVLSKDTKKFGNAEAKQNIMGAEVYVFLASQNPTPYDPSFAKTFRTRNGGVDAVRMYRAENNRSDILAVDWSEDIKVVSTQAAKRITLS